MSQDTRSVLSLTSDFVRDSALIDGLVTANRPVKTTLDLWKEDRECDRLHEERGFVCEALDEPHGVLVVETVVEVCFGSDLHHGFAPSLRGPKLAGLFAQERHRNTR